MSTSQNGWPALAADSPHLHRWIIPARSGSSTLMLRDGSAGFILAYIALRLAETIVPLFGKVLDDWGYAYRPVRGYTTTLSNHSSGTAMDLNATRHPLGRVGTWTSSRAAKIRTLLGLKMLRHVVRWGGDYHGRKDEMHFEINAPLDVCEQVAKRLMSTTRGKRILAANPGQAQVILS
ncbi:M15 family metallopeptidase [Nocardioides montaniterrae]